MNVVFECCSAMLYLNVVVNIVSRRCEYCILDCVLGVFAVLVLSNWLDIILLSAVKIQVQKGRINGGI